MFFILSATISCSAEVVINELMYNPSGNEYDFEFIELYGEGNISGWYFEGIDIMFPENSSIDGYLVIANTLLDEGEDNDILDRYPGLNCSHEYKGTLLNSGETILLRGAEGDIIDLVDYGDIVEENYSLERVDVEKGSNDPDNWKQGILGGTPGKENSVSYDTGCDWKPEILINSSVSEDIEFKVKVIKVEGDGKANLSVDKWIENSFGEVFKNYSVWDIKNSLNYKTSGTYSPVLAKGDAYFIKANITNISCNDKDTLNDIVSEMIFVPDEAKRKDLDSAVTIISSPEASEFGDIVKLKASIYRGDTGKYAVYAYVEDDDGKRISEKSTVHVKDKFTNYSMILPVQLKPNCNFRYEEGSHRIILEGLGVSDHSEIEIEGTKSSLCEKVKTTSSSDGSPKNPKRFEYSLIYFTKESDERKIDSEVMISNNDDEDYDIEIWSYLYRGSKCYSGGREENKKELVLKSGSSETVSFSNEFIQDAKPGSYRLKIKIRKNSQKTTNDLTEEIILEAEKTSENQENPDEETIDQRNEKGYLQGAQEPKDAASWSEALVYSSTSFKARNLAAYGIIGMISLIMIISVYNKGF